MQCPSCHADLPDDARFCIECGITLDKASTGPTVLLRADERATTTCAACGASNPGHAIFCVRCGQRMGDPVPRRAAPRPVIGDTGQGAPSLPTFRPQPAPAFGQGHGWEAMSVAILLIGIGVLFLGRLFWPGILIVVGIANFMRLAGHGRAAHGLRSTLWLFGLAILFMGSSKLFFPGILVLVGLSALITAATRGGRRWP